MALNDVVVMTTYDTRDWGDSRVDVIRLLVLVEAAIASTMAIEGFAAIAFSGPAAAPIALFGAFAAAGTFWLAKGMGAAPRKPVRLPTGCRSGSWSSRHWIYCLLFFWLKEASSWCRP